MSRLKVEIQVSNALGKALQSDPQLMDWLGKRFEEQVEAWWRNYTAEFEKNLIEGDGKKSKWKGILGGR